MKRLYLCTLISFACSDFVSTFYETVQEKERKVDANFIDMHMINAPDSDTLMMSTIDMHMINAPDSDTPMMPMIDMHMINAPDSDTPMMPMIDMHMINDPDSEPMMPMIDMHMINAPDASIPMLDQGHVSLSAPCGMNCPNIEMILIEAGIFNMGSLPDALPIHQVQIRNHFYVGKSEVTVGQYRTCVNAMQCTTPNIDEHCTWTEMIGENENHPINCVDWNQARTFAKWVGGDLLTEAQWEYVAKSQGQTTTYPWGETAPICEIANFTQDNGTRCVGQTSIVCSNIQGNTLQGVCDMSGNVWEWVLDEWHDSYDGAPIDDRAWCSDHECEMTSAMSRVNRGGSWFNTISFLNSSARNYDTISIRSVNVGFRIFSLRSIP